MCHIHFESAMKQNRLTVYIHSWFFVSQWMVQMREFAMITLKAYDIQDSSFMI